MRVVLIGGNPKGYLQPFSWGTLSGRRLRNIIAEVGLDCEIIDMTQNRTDLPTAQEKEQLKRRFNNGHTIVVFLGRFVEKQLRGVLPHGFYLPHPASRRRADLEKLKQELAMLKEGDLKL